MDKPPRLEDVPGIFRIAARTRAQTALCAWCLLAHRRKGVAPWERTIWGAVEAWIERRELAALQADYERRTGVTGTRRRGRPTGELRSPVNLRAVARRLKKDFRITFSQFADCVVDDIAPPLPEPHRTALRLGCASAIDNADVKKQFVGFLERKRDD